MKPNSKILLYDDYCPLCNWYSKLFVRFGLLSPDNRLPFSAAAPEILSAIDIDRAKNEIPLYDPETRITLYGIDALLAILGQRWKFIPAIGNNSVVKWFLRKSYKLISYNRKVIVARKCGDGKFDCSPQVNFKYRLFFMFLFLCFNTVMLIPLHKYVFTATSIYRLNLIELQLVHFVVVAVNFSIALMMNKQKGIEFLGQVNMLALITTLLLTLVMLTNLVFSLAFLTEFFLGAVTCFILYEYVRRMKFAGMLRHRPVIAINILSFAGLLGYTFL